ncbi:Single-stranded-DNA-specific exonuclease RecJ [hydrothermal vent metagenome]|uniref:Single-stranded-DNA-specific exonuclease RecJ n=1 Tax=hydrothermal vent metagenome TaxID=652676 RepID=A0A3B1D191_9ZZZZ
MKREKRWIISRGDKGAEETLIKHFSIDPVIARILVNRGVTTTGQADSFFKAPLGELLDPMLMASMPEAVDRILSAKDNKEKIVVFGDYDADGITATAILLRFFAQTGITADHYIPDRHTEGYGMSEQAIEKIGSGGCSLVITVDNGINSTGAVDFANGLGIDVIITDHHQPNGPLPNAVAVLNPARPDCRYPFKLLAGVGVAFKLITALRSEMSRRGASRESLPNLKRYLDLVVVGVVADCSALVGENRIIARRGLEELSRSAKAGLSALKSVAGVGRSVSGQDVGFALAPRLNSAGRMKSAEPGLELLMTEDRSRAKELAIFLDGENRVRKQLQGEIFEDAKKMALAEVDFSRDKAIVLGSEKWHSGIIGIAASKIKDEFYLPTALVSFNGDVGKGSARSIASFDLSGALKKCESALLKFGGHKAAAGFTVRKGDFDRFKSMFLAIACEDISEMDINPVLNIDCETDPGMMSAKLVGAIEALGPFGEGASRPKFACRGVRFSGPPFFMGEAGQHVRLAVKGALGKAKIIGFNMGAFFKNVSISDDSFDIVYTPEKNVWRGVERIQLRLEDIRLAEK